MKNKFSVINDIIPTHSNDSVQVSSDSGQCSAGDVDEPQTTEKAVNQQQHPFSTETERPLHLTSGNSNAITSSDDSDVSCPFCSCNEEGAILREPYEGQPLYCTKGSICSRDHP